MSCTSASASDQPGTAAVTVLPDGRHVPMLDKPTLDALLAQSVAPTPAAPVLYGVPLPTGIPPYLAEDVRSRGAVAGRPVARLPRGAIHSTQQP